MKKHRGFLSAILTIVLAVGMFFGGGVLSVFAEDKVEEVPQSLTSYYGQAFLYGRDRRYAVYGSRGRL